MGFKMKWILLICLYGGSIWAAPDANWSFNTLVKVMEDRGFDKWQRGDKLFMKGLRYAKDHGIDVTESGVMESLVIKNGGFYFKEDPVNLRFSPQIVEEALQTF
jgi:hypothetical protein